MLRFIDVLEEPREQGCFLCDAKPGDGHWSNCPLSDSLSDEDSDTDRREQSAEIL